MNMVSVTSSNLKSVGYDEVRKKLRVEFHNGTTYEYSGVAKETHSGLMGASSIGEFFSKHIRNKHKHVKV